MIRVVELFSGIGAQASALERAGIPHELVAVCEIDKYAYASYCAIHGSIPNLGDITKLERLPDNIDLLTYSFPCQDLSIAGNCKGMTKDSGTRSGLLWEVERLLLEAKTRDQLPRILQMENVDAIINNKNRKQFDSWIRSLSEIGYTSSWKILNAKDFNIPQNRARCFMVSCLDGTHFDFPEPIQKRKRLADCLEAEVDEKYFLSEDRMSKFVVHKERHQAAGHGFGFSITEIERNDKACTSRPKEEEDTLILVGNLKEEGRFESASRVYDPRGICPTINTCGGGGLEPKIIVVPQLVIKRKNNVDLEDLKKLLKYSKERSKKSIKDISQILEIPQTMVEHWFRSDDSFSIPCAEAWIKLKNCLNIENSDFDSQILEFESYEGVYEKSQRIYNPEYDSPAITCCDSPKIFLSIRNNTTQGFIDAEEEDGLILDQPNSKTKRGRVQKGVSPTIMTSGQVGIVQGMRIRYLTPRECWRVMDFTDEEFNAVANIPTSESQLYKQAGNSICVGVLEAIYRKLYTTKHNKQPSILDF